MGCSLPGSSVRGNLQARVLEWVAVSFSNWGFWTAVLEKTLESPLDCKDIQPVHSEDQPWDFFGRNDAKAETPLLWPLHVKSWLIGKDSDAGRDWGQEEKGTTEDEMAGWHHGLDGSEFEWTPGVGDGQRGLVCCDSWGPKSQTRLSDWNELNWTDMLYMNFKPHTHKSKIDKCRKKPRAKICRLYFNEKEKKMKYWHMLQHGWILKTLC